MDKDTAALDPSLPERWSKAAQEDAREPVLAGAA